MRLRYAGLEKVNERSLDAEDNSPPHSDDV